MIPRCLSVCFALLMFAGATLAQLPAFPGAEGFGKFATGARGGTVYHVTTTNDSGAGSFRDAVSVANRTIVFDIGGIIDYQAPRYAPKANITIAGQTAPGDGVTLYGNGLSFSGSHNNVVRFLRVREGINGDSGTDAIGIANGHDMIFDHMSVSWGRDETFSVNASGAATNITIQSSIIAQGLQTHSAGGLIQTDGGVSIYRCLYIDNDTRNPKVKFKNEFVNNVIANWETIGYNMGGDSAGDSYANAFNNYFIKGPNSSSSAFGGGNANFHIYATNNWYDSSRDGVLNGGELAFANYGPMDLQTVPFDYPITNAVPPLTALKLAISDVGTSQRRDIVDERLMFELQSGGLLGQTIGSEYATPMSGPGVIRNGPTPLDTDQDGMPDYWENGTGSNPNVADNNDPSPSGSGYTRLEDYLNWLAEPHGLATNNATCEIELRQFTRGFTNYSPVFTVANATNGTVTLVAGGKRARFVPTPGYVGAAGFTFTVADSDGGTLTRPMNLFFTPVVTNTVFIWRGDALTNNWNANGDLNWFDNYSLVFPFHNGDTVAFDDSGFNSPSVNLVGSLTPASVTITAAQNYTLTGSGSLAGVMTFLKSGAGIFRLNNTNNFSGTTTVSNGTLLVNGALVQSAVSVLSGGSTGGSGKFGNGVTVANGGSVIAGDGIGTAGTMTITNALTENGGVVNRFDLSDDPTGLVKANDQVKVIGNLNLSGVNTIQVNLLNGPLANGDYVLFTYTGALSGSLANLTVVGANGTLTSSAGQILLHVDNTRAPATLVWLGDGSANIWDAGTNATWLNGTNQDRFYFGDTVLFDNSGSSSSAVNLLGSLSPAALTVDSANNFMFGGTGKISGTGSFTKTNSGTLTITTTNDFTGPVIIGNGVLAVSRLANGGLASGLGASSSDPTNLVFYGGALRYTGGSTATDRSATLNNNAALEVVSGTLTYNGTFTGSGALIKTGAGTLTIPTNNTHTGGVIISNGTVNLTTTTARDSGLGTGTTTLAGGTLQLYGYAASTSGDYATFNRPIFATAGTTNSLLTPPRAVMGFTLNGSGTVNLTVDYVRDVFNGNWSGFSGTLNISGRVVDSEFRVANSAGYANATINLNDNAVMTRSGSSIYVEIGALGGTALGRIGPGDATSSGSNYRVGNNNQDAVFLGRILSDGVNAVNKIGSGNWTLGGASTYSGGTIVDGGTLTVINSTGSATGSGSVTLNTGTTLAGNGIISGTVTMNSGATLMPGAPIGTLTVGSLSLAAGTATVIEINKSGGTKDMVSTSGTLTFGGTLTVTNIAGALTSADSFKIFNATTYAGSFTATNLPPLAPGLQWNLAALATSGTISVVGTNYTGPQPIIWAGDGIANVWDIGASTNWLSTNGVPRTFANDDSVTLSDVGSETPPLTLNALVTPGAMTVNATKDYTLTGSGKLSGVMALTKTGSGKFIMTTTNDYTGGTTISGGTLQIGDGVNALGGIAGSIVNNGALTYANPVAFSTSTVLGGSGNVNKTGPGTLTFTAGQIYPGGTTISAGQVEFSSTPPPGNITNNSRLVFKPSAVLVCPGVISGSGSVSMNGSGNIMLSGANSYTGGTSNNSGILVLANNSAAGTGSVYVTNGTGSVMVSGGVVITNDFVITGSVTTDLIMQATNGIGTWAGAIIIPASAQWRLGADTGGTFVFTGNGNIGSHFCVVCRGAVQFASNAVVNCTTSFLGRDSGANNRSANITFKDNASASLGSCSVGGGQAGGGVTVTVQNNASVSFGVNSLDVNNVNRTTAISSIRLNGGTFTVGGFTKTKTAQTNIIGFNGGLLKASAANAAFLPAFNVSTNYVQAGGAKIDDGGFAITIAAPLLHDPTLGTADGGLTKLGAGTLTLSGAETYTGNTVVSNGTLILTGAATLASASNLNIAAGVFDASALGGFTLTTGKTISGNGAVNGNFTVNSGATLAPGNNVGTLTFSNNLTLAAGSVQSFELSTVNASDKITVLGTLALGGTVNVTNVAGFTAGTYTLFTAASISGSLTLGATPSGYNYTLTNTANAVQLIVVSTNAAPPVFSGPGNFSGNNLVFGGSNGTPFGNYFVLTSTNVSLPASNWTRLFTNQFDANGNFSFTGTVSTNVLDNFFRLQLP